jgi:hypothetical protein
MAGAIPTLFSDAWFSTVSTTASDIPSKLVFLADGPRIFLYGGRRISDGGILL